MPTLGQELIKYQIVSQSAWFINFRLKSSHKICEKEGSFKENNITWDFNTAQPNIYKVV